MKKIRSKGVKTLTKKVIPIYGYLILTTPKVISEDSHHRLEIQTGILNQNHTPLVVVKSESQIPSMAGLVLSVNGSLNAGKFILNNHGELAFSSSVNKTFKDDQTIEKAIDFFEKIAFKALEYHLPRILFAANLLTFTAFQNIISEAERTGKKIRRLRDEHVFIFAELLTKSNKLRKISKFSSPENDIKCQSQDYKVEAVVSEKNDDDEASFEKNENLMRMSLQPLWTKDLLPPKFKEQVNLIEEYVLKTKARSQNASIPVEFQRYCSSHEKDVSDMHFGGPVKGNLNAIEPEKRISAKFVLKSQPNSPLMIMKANRLCSLYVVYGQAEFFDKNNRKNMRTCNLLRAVIAGEDQKMIDPLHNYLDYFYKADASDAYHMNILPHYTHRDQPVRGEFYCEFQKHGTVENFIHSKRDTAKFVLSMLRGIVHSQLYLANKHGMIHTDVSLYNVYITRGMQPKVGFLNKVYVINEDRLKKVGIKTGGLKEHWNNQVDPSNYVLSAPEVLKKDKITEKVLVFMIGTLIMQYIFECKPKIKKKLHEPQIYEKQMKGTFSLNFMPTDISSKGPREVLEPLYIFTKACLEIDHEKRPSLEELGLFLQYVQKSLEYTFL